MTRWACLTLFAATAGLYGVMVVWSLPKIAAAAGGLLPFDLRPGGYSAAEARAFLAALDPEAVRFYREVQLGFDSAYPAMMAVSLAVALAWAWRGAPRWVVVLAVLCAVAGAGLDYLENFRVYGLLAAGPDAVTDGMVAAASWASRGKAVMTTLAMTALLAGLGWRGWRRVRRR